MSKMKLVVPALLIALLGLFLFAPLTASAASQPAATSTFTNIPVSGTTQNGGVFNGTLNITRFAVQNHQLVALGTLSGTLTNAAGQAVGSVTNQAVTLPVAATGTCQILNLTLGPLDLNLLGLMVHLNQVVLNITAQQAPGNLLGNLLCAVTNLLNNGGPLTGIAGLLNNILHILG